MNQAMSGIELAGFADPVLDAQASFRAVLEAMAHPGRVVTVGSRLTPPSELHRATAAVLLTLVDGDAPLWLAPDCAPALAWLTFHCGAVPADRASARFAVANALPALTTLAQGTDIAPELSATLIVQLPALGEGDGYVLSGPGLRTAEAFAAAGLPRDFVARWRENHAGYPLGVDLILCAGDRLAALPRSVAVREG